jgi:hypothetical protein
MNWYIFIGITILIVIIRSYSKYLKKYLSPRKIEIIGGSSQLPKLDEEGEFILDKNGEVIIDDNYSTMFHVQFQYGALNPKFFSLRGLIKSKEHISHKDLKSILCLTEFAIFIEKCNDPLNSMFNSMTYEYKYFLPKGTNKDGKIEVVFQMINWDGENG